MLLIACSLFTVPLTVSDIFNISKISLFSSSDYSLLCAITFLLSAIPCAFGLLMAVGRHKQCLDFTLTYHAFYVLISIILMDSPVSVRKSSLITIVLSIVICTMLSEFLCRRSELREIPISSLSLSLSVLSDFGCMVSSIIFNSIIQFLGLTLQSKRDNYLLKFSTYLKSGNKVNDTELVASLPDAHVAYLLLRHCASAQRIAFLMRNVDPASTELFCKQFDNAVIRAMEIIASIQLCDHNLLVDLLQITFNNIKVTGAHTMGSITLDSLTLQKIVDKFKFVLVKFDHAYPHGNTEEEFFRLAQSLSASTNVIIADITVFDYGRRENSDLADRYNLSSSKFPIFLLFTNYSLENPRKYEGLVTEDMLITFLRNETGSFLGLTANQSERELIIRQLKSNDLNLLHENVNLYVTTMQTFLHKSQKWIADEKARLLRLMSAQMSEAKRSLIVKRRNILRSFEHVEL
ncbi:hypothetical protein GJ496_010094 [Pomphorhynchus laevis]|nr:hypothetical protein GJ496_010094 [Pomphorhynchus laevis]